MRPAKLRRAAFVLSAGLWLCACATTPDPVLQEPATPDPSEANPAETAAELPDVIATPDPDPDPAPVPFQPTPDPLALPIEPPEEALIEELAVVPIDPFTGLDHWGSADLAPALAAFQRSCPVLLKGEEDQPLNSNLPEYGTYGDWADVCEKAEGATDPREFFEAYFLPLPLSLADQDDGLLTGYYEPEVEVRYAADTVFSEPILAKPESDDVRTLPRSELNAQSARVIAYGRPIDVFFLQVQGSGRLHYEDDRVLRAAYGGNNGYGYKSIGRVLIERGEMSPDQSSKRNIEDWMEQAGPEKARALMNENSRYIFFTEQKIAAGEGPRGAMQVPLTPMGSIAVDPRYHPYGTLAWLDTRLPQSARDFGGGPTGLLTVAQDTGSAIKGGLRGDLFFGSGLQAGALAGMMKHRVRWTLLVPRDLALELTRESEKSGV